MSAPKLPVLEESPWANEVYCAICTRPGHVARFCPYTAIGRLRQERAKAMSFSDISIELVADGSDVESGSP